MLKTIKRPQVISAMVLILSFLLLLPLLSAPAVFAEEGVSINVSANLKNAKPGETVTVTVTAKSSTAFLGASATVQIQTDFFEVVSVSATDATSYGQPTANTATFTYSCNNLNGVTEQKLGTIKLKVKSTAQPKDDGTVTVTEGEYANKNGLTAKCTLTSVSVSVPTPSSNAKLTSLTLNGATLSPKFSSTVYEYTTAVEQSVTSLQVTAKAQESGAKVAISGNKNWDWSKQSSQKITVTVTAPSGSTQKYTITVTAKAPALSSLTLKDASLNRNFASTVTEYSLVVDKSVTSVEVTATAQDPDAKVTVSGNKNWNWSKQSHNYIIVRVTAPNGSTNQYNITVTAKETPASSEEPIPPQPPVSSDPVLSEPPVSSQPPVSSDPVSSDPVLSEPPVSSQPPISSDDPATNSSHYEESSSAIESAPAPLGAARANLILHIAYIGGMIVCLLIGCMIGYYIRGKKES